MKSTTVPAQEPKPDPLADLEIYAMPGHLIRRMQQAASAIFDIEMGRAGYDLTSVQYAAMTAIVAAPGLDQASLAAAIGYDRVTIGGVIDRLEAKGLVRREIVATDRRARRLHLESAGRSMLAKVTPVVRRIQSRMMAGLSPKEAEQLMKLLRKALDVVGDESRASIKTARRAPSP